MKMKSVRFIVFSALLCMFMIPQSASAEVNKMPSNFYELKSQEGKDIYISSTEKALITQVNITPVMYDQYGQARAWYYTENVTVESIYTPNETVSSQIYVRREIAILDVNGKNYIAEGYLDLAGTLYDYPEKGYKTGLYEGTVGCYIY